MGVQAIYEDVMDHLLTAAGRDPRTRDLPITNSYPTVIAIIIAYVLIVKKFGPAYMAKRKPYNIEGLIITYNFIQVAFNLVLFIAITPAYLFNPSYSWSCMNTDITDFSYYNIRLKWLGYLYFLNKIMDCFDTIFFVMRKKFSHVSLLHVYHHATMVWGSFLYVNVLFASQISIIGYLNTLVHTLMYTYYLLSSLKLKINLNPWKPRLTQIQIAQFVYYLLKFSVALANNWCGLSEFWLRVMIIENIIMIVLFSNFYYRTYVMKKAKKVHIKGK